MRAQKKKTPIPDFKNRQEEAEFWDSHSFADYWDEFKRVEVRMAEPFLSDIVITLDSEAMRKLDKKARERGTDIIALARAWILEHLQAEG